MKEYASIQITRVFNKLVEASWANSMMPRQPGYLVGKLRGEDREIIKQLKTEHINQKPEWFGPMIKRN